jgi:hypothetical protein
VDIVSPATGLKGRTEHSTLVRTDPHAQLADVQQERHRGLPNTIAAKVGSSRLAIFEALASNDPEGLVIPEIIRASGVPKSTVHRVVRDFEARGLIVTAGRRRKAPVFRLNPADDEVIDVSRALNAYAMWRNAKELEIRKGQERSGSQRLRTMARGRPKRAA